MSLFIFRNVIGATLAATLLVGAGGCSSFSRKPEPPWSSGYLKDDVEYFQPGKDNEARQASHNEPDDQGGFLFTEDSGADDPSTAPKSPTGLQAFSPSAIKSKIKGYFEPTRNRAEGRRRFDEAEQAFNERRYNEAIDLYGQAAKRWPGSTLEHDAMFMTAESYFKSHKYPEANEAYGELLKQYTNSRYLEKVVARQFAIAQYWEQLEQWRPGSWYSVNLSDESRPWRGAAVRARETYHSIHLNDPTGPLADDAIMAIANHHYARDEFEKADFQYALLRTDHPKSEHVFEAYLFGIQSKMKKYLGPDYNGTPLDEAQELLDQLKLQFPDRIDGKERARLERVQQEIRVQKAKRDWHLAQYYEKRSDFRAARSYYEKIAADYPDNSISRIAEQRIAELSDKPDNAPNYVPWLTKIFEPHERRR